MNQKTNTDNMPSSQAFREKPALESGTGFRLAERTNGLRPSAVREILKVTERPDVISFAGGLPAPELFPVEDMARASQEIFQREGAAALQYSVTEGYKPLREWIVNHLRETSGLAADENRVLITNGSQQGIELLAKVLIDPGDVVLVENPSYLSALQVFRSYQAQPIGLESDEHGLLPRSLSDYLDSAAPRPKFLYLVPNFQNPTGVVLSAERRTEIERIASAATLPIIEDDPYGRLRFEGEHIPAIGSMGDGRLPHIYLGTASKILAPGLRVAWMAVSDTAVFSKIVAAKQAADLHSSSFTQRLVYELLRQPGYLENREHKLRGVYSRRRDAMLSALERHMPAGCHWSRPAGGMFLWVTLPDTIDTFELLHVASAEGIAFVPGGAFAAREGTMRNTMRLNFSNADEARIETGIERLGRAVRAM